jgi:hypothetical protein
VIPLFWEESIEFNLTLIKQNFLNFAISHLRTRFAIFVSELKMAAISKPFELKS